MDFALNEDQQAVQDLFHRFAEEQIRPQAAQLDTDPQFPSALFKQAGELGFFGMRYAEPEGSGSDLLSYLIAVEELSWGSLAVAAACTMQSLMGTFFVHRFATGELRERLVASALAGETLGTICMTEPDAGSDLFSMTTRAEQRDGVWYITGQKTWITSAPMADMFTVFARTGDKELSVFLVEKGAAGLTVGRFIEKMGVRASLTSEVSFDDTPAACLLGELGGGMSALREILVQIRLMTAAMALGVARAAYEEALAYSTQREQFGKPISRFQAVQDHIARMRTELEAARRLTHWAAWRSETGAECTDEASMAKLFASETAMDVCDRAARLLASYGYASEYPVERYLRDARFTIIGGGTSEILRMNIARGTVRAWEAAL
ncbi:MAG: acyl-CoA dehydrogenase family protein [Planctomycetota bacterium]|jgi:butyryl-CoA dehydrogenase|nr:acyl-CoA dehydrogenase [Candidatus Woesearchaeota archaeon]MDP6386495.1 acyl-CoA dehydrogenase family protein [Planctomycetota bacterium]